MKRKKLWERQVHDEKNKKVCKARGRFGGSVYSGGSVLFFGKAGSGVHRISGYESTCSVVLPDGGHGRL